MLSKQCVACQEEKDVAEFFKRAAAKDGLNASCKKCCNNMNTRYRKENPDVTKKHRQLERERKRIRYQEWKEQQGCSFCSETFPQCLELHHVNPSEKDKDPSQMFSLSWNKFMEEASKCIVVCANCHRKVHYGHISQQQVDEVYKNNGSFSPHQAVTLAL